MKKEIDEVLDHGLIIDVKLKVTRDSKHTFLLICGIIIGFLVCSWIFNLAFTPPYVDLSHFSFALIIAIITLKYLYSLLNFKQLYLTPTKVIIHTTLFGEKYQRNILGFGVREGTHTKEKEEEEDKIAILFSKGEYELISSGSIFNFHQVRTFLEKHYDNIGDKAFKGRDKLTSQVYLTLLLISSFFFLGSFLFSGFERDNLNNLEEKIQSFEITLQSAPTKNDNSYTLKSQEYSDFIFEIKGTSYQVCNNNLHTNFKRGDILTIGIKHSVYNFKILKNTAPDFWTKHFDWENISVFSLETNGEKIIDKNEAPVPLEIETN